MAEAGIRKRILHEVKGGFKIGRLKYETDGKNVWVLDLWVNESRRWHGVATRLLERLMQRTDAALGYFNPGCFVGDGVHLKKTIFRLAKNYPNMKLCADFEKEMNESLRSN